MLASRRMLFLLLSAVLLVGTLFYVEHPLIRGIKEGLSLVGVIDSEQLLVGMRDVRSFDHVRGDLSSDIYLVEYSDFSCFMCAAMQQVFDRLVVEENIALISRHLYPRYDGDSFALAVAAECVGKYGGEGAYRTFSRYLYDSQRVPGALADEALQLQASRVGVEVTDFLRCREDDVEIRERVRGDSEEGWRLGARGTPYIVVMYMGEPVGISYANRYTAFLDRVQSLVDQAQLRGG